MVHPISPHPYGNEAAQLQKLRQSKAVKIDRPNKGAINEIFRIYSLSRVSAIIISAALQMYILIRLCAGAG